MQRAALFLSTGLTVLLFAALAWFGLCQIQTERVFGTTSEALAVPQWWYTAGIPLLSLLIIARVVEAGWRAARRGD